MVPGFGLVIMLACAVFYYRAGEAERSSGLLWGGISILLWLGASMLLHWGLFGCLATQFGLFAGLTAMNILRDSKKRRSDR